MPSGRPELACRVGAMLGEGPVWVTREQTLWFVDIKGHQVHRFDPADAALTSWSVAAQPGWILPISGGGFAVGMQCGIERFDPADGSFAPIVVPEAHLPGNRLNDATTDAHGRIWFGSMDDAEAALSGALYTLDARGVVHSGLPEVAITNGPAFSPDGRTLYHTDTLGRTIHAVEVNDDHSLGAAKTFVEIEDGAGYPDGPVVDSAGNVWTGLFGGWAARCYAPDGSLIETVRLPTANITKIAFGGADLKTAYVTTARKGLDATALATQPEAGDLFAFTVDVAGLPATEAIVALH
ncbi:SMP-30/gluconolactonase/LRE family protein [Polymorphobacter sp. PAMC 29334]|uniref:SMP-30/gluconolactonase/LRE family protein n=1 Tax=Polymorphobacter sp. PAMC 29334 TaxID=2862331 RepID=UPI001C673AF9|nr:SMP-30/gluconolactonase/LRE family protein [Polymorphobacter sp. PAMC 29334]QYE35851.1 SMP-30/gluconolactonase/LRE family protein [Polymorphobacter sp. PAMC 29334]